MSSPVCSISCQAIYALSWKCAQDGQIAVDIASGTVVDANPAMEVLMARSREELVGAHIATLHPEDERERVTDGFEHGLRYPVAAVCLGFHIQRKNGQVVPVQIWRSEPLTLGGREMAIVEFRDISLRLQRQHQAASRNWALSAFSAAALALGKAQSEQDLLQSICDAITCESAYLLAYVCVAQEDPGKTIRIVASSGSALQYTSELSLSWAEDSPQGHGPCGACIRTGEIQIVDNVESITNFARWRKRAKRFGVQSVVSVPVRIDDRWRGALTVYSANQGTFETEPVEVFQRLGEQMVHGIRALRHKELLEAERFKVESSQRCLTEALAASVSALVAAMETRDPYTAGHESRVAALVVAIGREFGFDEERLQGMRLAAMVHDIGKIAVPYEILTKTRELSRAEFELVKMHPETGYMILKDVPFPWPVAEMVRQHHEKIDGSGYPLGLTSDGLLMESKIMAVADIVESMASDRPYRRSLGLEAALAEIERMAGTQLDADAVRVCASLLREKRVTLAGLQWL